MSLSSMSFRLFLFLSFVSLDLFATCSGSKRALPIEDTSKVIQHPVFSSAFPINHETAFRADVEISSWVPISYNFALDHEKSSKNYTEIGEPFCYLKEEENVLLLKSSAKLYEGDRQLSLVDSDLKGSYLLVLTHEHEFRVLSIIDPDSQILVLRPKASFSPTSLGISIPETAQIAFSQSTDYFYFVTEKYMLQFTLLDFDSPPRKVQEYENGNLVYYAFEFSGFLFLALGEAGINVYDLRNPDQIQLAFVLDRGFFGAEAINCTHFLINQTLIHDATPDSNGILEDLGVHGDKIGDIQPNERLLDIQELKRKRYNGDYLIIADEKNGVHFVDISEIAEGDIYLVPKSFSYLSKAVAVARNQDVLFVLGSVTEESTLAVFEIFLTETNLTDYASDDHQYSGLSAKNIGVVNRVIEMEKIQDLFVDEKYLWMISRTFNDAVINGVSSFFIDSIQTLRRPIAKENVLSVQKFFAFGKQYLLSLGDNAISIDQITTIPAYVSCSFDLEFVGEHSGEEFHYNLDIYTLYCDEKYGMTNEFEFICKFSFNVTFGIMKSFIETTFTSSSSAFQTALLFGLTLSLSICLIGVCICCSLKRKLKQVTEKYELLRSNESEIMEKSKDNIKVQINEADPIKNQEQPEFNQENQIARPTILQEEEPSLEDQKNRRETRQRRKIGKNQKKEDVEFGIDDQPAEYNKKLYE